MEPLLIDVTLPPMNMVVGMSSPRESIRAWNIHFRDEKREEACGLSRNCIRWALDGSIKPLAWTGDRKERNCLEFCDIIQAYLLWV